MKIINKNNRNNIAHKNKSFIERKSNLTLDYNIDNWKDKKINLNFFENKNLIKELRAKYLPNNSYQIQKEFDNENELNKINNCSKKEYINSNINKGQEFSISIDNISKSKQNSLSNNNKENITNNINNKNSKENNGKNNNYKYNLNNNGLNFLNNAKTSKSNKKNIIIENRFYTEIINSNILIDNRMKLNSFHDETISSNNLNKKEKNHYINLYLKKEKSESNKNNNLNSTNNKETFNSNNTDKKENYYNLNQENNNIVKIINENKDKEKKLLLENIKMKTEIKNYEKLITPLINYINNINRLLKQKEINPNDIPKIIEQENESKSSFYINNLISNLNESKNDIFFQLFELNKINKYSRKRNYNKRRNSKMRRCRSAENIKNYKNYFYEDTSDKYIFDYYKGRNLDCSACLIGNNTSQKGYSPGICFHLDKDNKNN